MQPSDDGFETKSLFRLMETFTITKEGRLIHHARRYVKDARYPHGFNEQAPFVTVDIDMEFHGDIVVTGFWDNSHADYFLRFTHGRLEWARAKGSLSEDQQNIAITRNLAT